MCPTLIGGATADVAIVGGGYTGLWTALALRQRRPDLDVVVLEADSCGAGGSGRNGGFLHGYCEMLPKLARTFGVRDALRIAELGSEAQKAIRDFCESRPEDVWLEEAGVTVASTSPVQDSAVEEAIQAGSLLPIELRPYKLSRHDLVRSYGTDSLRRAALFPEGATVQPMRLLRTMQRAAREAGVRIYENGPVHHINVGHLNVVTTRHGSVRCGEVVIATNAWSAASRPYSNHLTNLGSYVVVTEPVPALIAEMERGAGLAVKDGRMFLHWARTTRDQRLVVGTGAGPMSYGGRVTGVHTRHQPSVWRAAKAVRQFFPAAEQAHIIAAWGGPIDVSPDRLPFFGTLPKPASTMAWDIPDTGSMHRGSAARSWPP